MDIKIGAIVRYADEWSTPQERHLRHIVRENVLNPVTGKMTRWVIETINGSKYLGYLNPVETVDAEMIIPVEA